MNTQNDQIGDIRRKSPSLWVWWESPWQTLHHHSSGTWARLQALCQINKKTKQRNGNPIFTTKAHRFSTHDSTIQDAGCRDDDPSRSKLPHILSTIIVEFIVLEVLVLPRSIFCCCAAVAFSLPLVLSTCWIHMALLTVI